MIRIYIHQKLDVGIEAALDFKQKHYIFNVMRCKIFDQIVVFNAGEEFIGEILSKEKLLIKSKLSTHEQDDRLKLYTCIPKNLYLKNVMRQATELGATEIQPVISSRSCQEFNLDRSYSQVVEAAEQCGRTFLPEILPPVNLKSLDFQNLLVYNKHKGVALDPLRFPQILIGPEGGFTDEEQNWFINELCLPWGTLRVDTAVVVALTLARGVK